MMDYDTVGGWRPEGVVPAATWERALAGRDTLQSRLDEALAALAASERALSSTAGRDELERRQRVEHNLALAEAVVEAARRLEVECGPPEQGSTDDYAVASLEFERALDAYDAGRRKVMKITYLAHPVSGDVPGNLAEARRWIRWLYDHVPGIAVLAPWITTCEVLDENNPEHRKLGLRCDIAVIARCDAILLVGPVLSAGMRAELLAAESHGLHILNFVGYDRTLTTASHLLERLAWEDRDRGTIR